jgi:hypothetical protein
LQLRERPEAPLLHGAAASGIALFSLPLAERHRNGLPKAAFNFYFGGAPTAAVSGPENFMSVPLNLGIGASFSPAPWVTLTPWFEAAPSANLDSTISELNFSEALQQRIDEIEAQGDVDEIELLTNEDINQVVNDSVELRFSTQLAFRGGVTVGLHLSESWDLNAYATATSWGSAFGGAFVGTVGAGLGYHWDEIVPAVLPAERRLRGETCEDIEQRFMMCPGYVKLRAAQQSSTPALSSEPALPPIESAPSAIEPAPPPIEPVPPAIQPAPQPNPPPPVEPAPELTPPGAAPVPPPPPAAASPGAPAPSSPPQPPAASF